MSEATLRRHALQIFQAGVDAADPKAGIDRHVKLHDDKLIAGRQKYKLDKFRRILVTGAGKASANMAVALEQILKKRITAGLINTKYGHTAPLRHIELNECSHPVPDTAGEAGARRIADMMRDATEDDLVIALISGGASALVPLPADGITLEDKQATTGLLLQCGANIHEINTVRKHISGIKGGQLAALAYPATVLALILSDVIGDDLDVIGSGITAPDRSTFADALAILDRFGIRERVPAAVRERLEAAPRETPKPGSEVFDRVQNVLIGSTRLALEASAAEAKNLGYKTLVLSSLIEGETREVARTHAAIGKEIVASGQPVKAPACILSGGETTVTIRGEGKGGRNQEFALAAAIDIANTPDLVILSGGTDGTDGPTDAAGAIADGTTLTKAPNARDYLNRNDSYNCFEPLGDLIKTGPTGTNVADIRIILAGKTGRKK